MINGTTKKTPAFKYKKITEPSPFLKSAKNKYHFHLAYSQVG